MSTNDFFKQLFGGMSTLNKQPIIKQPTMGSGINISQKARMAKIEQGRAERARKTQMIELEKQKKRGAWYALIETGRQKHREKWDSFLKNIAGIR